MSNIRSPDLSPTIFSSSQPNQKMFLSSTHFEWSLHYGLLFNPVGLVSPDPYLLSPFVVDYLCAQPERETWYEGALVEGLIVPFARKKNLSGYYELWTDMEESKIQNDFTEASKIAAKRLDELGGLATPDHWKPWPDGMGIRFGALVEERIVQRDYQAMIPDNLRGGDFEKLRSYLERTKIYRDDIENAKRRLAPEHGLRASEVMNASARRIFGREVKNIDTLLLEIKESGSRSTQEFQDAKQFYKTLIDLYNENMAAGMNSTNSVPDFDVATRIFSDVGTVDFDRGDDLTGLPITEDVELPPLEILRAFDFQFVRKCRGSNEFEDYVHELTAWQRASGDPVARDNVTKSVQAYAQKIRELSKHDHRFFDQYRVVVGYKPSALRLGGRVLSIASGALTEFGAEKLLERCGDFTMAFPGLPPVVTATLGVVTSGAGAIVGGILAGKSFDAAVERIKHHGEHWLYISKLKKRKVRLIARTNSAIEVHNNATPIVRAKVASSMPGETNKHNLYEGQQRTID